MSSVNLRDNYFYKLGGCVRSIPPMLGSIPEEESPELKSSTKTFEEEPVECLKVLDIDLNSLPEPIFKYFVDGIELTSVVAQYEGIQDLPPIPVIMARIMAAACDESLNITNKCECYALIFPHEAIKRYLSQRGITQIPDPSQLLPVLDHHGDFYK